MVNEMSKEELKELKEMGYESEEEFVSDILGIDESELEEWFDSYDSD